MVERVGAAVLPVVPWTALQLHACSSWTLPCCPRGTVARPRPGFVLATPPPLPHTHPWLQPQQLRRT
jgi:hypothetical protein